MDLSTITPMILTYNEASNIEDTLERLQWARSVLVIDSHSTDETDSICSRFANVTLIKNPFRSFSEQANFGLRHISTEWVLSMDCDYKVSPAFVNELEQLPTDMAITGWRASFVYSIYGQNLRGNLYPPRTVLYRPHAATYQQDGHAHRVKIDGEVRDLKAPIVHDDRKPLSVWLRSQLKYASQERAKLLVEKRSGWKDWIRQRTLLAPVLTVPYCLVIKGLIFDGRAGLYYTAQRVLAELVLLIELMDAKLIEPKDQR